MATRLIAKLRLPSTATSPLAEVWLHGKLLYALLVERQTPAPTRA